MLMIIWNTIGLEPHGILRELGVATVAYLSVVLAASSTSFEMSSDGITLSLKIYGSLNASKSDLEVALPTAPSH